MTESCCCPTEFSYDDNAAWTDGTIDATCCSKAVRVKTDVTLSDRIGWWKVRWCIGRGSFMIRPGLYAVGSPDSASDVLVTANYKMSFDHVRRHLGGRNVWILVLDTKGINVWCAAGKGTFGTEELITRIGDVKLNNVVDTNQVIIPQLGAPGVCARTVTKETGFKVVFGPVRASDIPAYLDNDRKAEPEMRRVSFNTLDRIVLIPVELVLAGQYILPAAAVIMLAAVAIAKMSGAETAGLGARSITALFSGWFAGSVMGPAMLPVLPGRAFASKGMFAGLIAAAVLWFILGTEASALELTTWILAIPAIASFITMNFTGTSTYTSPSGVEKEMKYAVPAQALACLGGIITLIAAFIRI